MRVFDLLIYTVPVCLGISLNWAGLNDVRQKLLGIQGHRPLLESGVSLLDPAMFDSWLTDESAIAFDRMLKNVASKHNPDLPEVIRGGVIASPSISMPDYYYIWTRDAAITINTVLHRFADGGAQNHTLQDILEAYLDFSYKVQRTDNPSGDFKSRNGLGEPKFNVDGSAFTKNWGRPQRDGPALRATTIMNYINTINGYDKEQYQNIYRDVITPDLQYVVNYWNSSGFDLWEEVDGNHFFTLMVQQRAMFVGSQFAAHLGDDKASKSYSKVADTIRQELESNYFDPKKNHVIETLDSSRSGLDCGIIVGSLYGVNTNNVALGADNETTTSYRPFDDSILSSINAMVNDMSVRYPINEIRLDAFESAGVNRDIVGVGLGRYPEDVYNGVGTSLGNPWFLCTAGVSETMYILARYLFSRPSDFSLEINTVNQGFYQPFLGQLEGYGPGFELHRESAEFSSLIDNVINYGDSFLDVVREHQDSEGNLSEQFNRFNGYMAGARQLTWSFGQFYRATRQRGLALEDIRQSS